MTALTYLIGEPGAGKSTLVRNLLADATHLTDEKIGVVTFSCWEMDGGVVHVLGPPYGAGPFPGTDGMSMSVGPKVPTVMSLVGGCWLGEGDRLTSAKFFDATRAEGIDLAVLLLDIPAEVAAQRRTARAEEHGLATQDARWLKGRRTKVANLRHHVTELIEDPDLADITATILRRDA